MFLPQPLGQTPGARLPRKMILDLTAGNGAIATAIFVLLVLACSMLEANAASKRKVQTVEQLRTALREDRFVPRAFIKGDQVRVYFTNAEQRLMFKADWDRARTRVQGFSSHLAELKFDAS